MDLLIMRHAEAEAVTTSGDDADRALTSRGRKRTRAAAQTMKRLSVIPQRVLTSPYLRARETAGIVAEELGVPLEDAERLSCGATLGDWAAVVEAHEAVRCILLVGHEPDCSQGIGTLIGGGRIAMKKGALACVSAEVIAPGGGRLEWLLAPPQLTG